MVTHIYNGHTQKTEAGGPWAYSKACLKHTKSTNSIQYTNSCTDIRNNK